MENWSDFDFVCSKIMDRHERGETIEDILDKTPYLEAELIEELIRHYFQTKNAR